MSKIGKKIPSRSCLTEAILVIGKKIVRFKMGSALEAVAGNRSRVLGRDRSPGRLPSSLHGLSSFPFSHPGIVSDVPGRLSSGSSLAARGRGDACQRGLRNRPGSVSRLLQSSFPCGEGIWQLETRDLSLSPE